MNISLYNSYKLNNSQLHKTATETFDILSVNTVILQQEKFVASRVLPADMFLPSDEARNVSAVVVQMLFLAKTQPNLGCPIFRAGHRYNLVLSFHSPGGADMCLYQLPVTNDILKSSILHTMRACMLLMI